MKKNRKPAVTALLWMFVLVLLPSLNWAQTDDHFVYRRVAAVSGLNMREKPIPTAKIMDLIPNGESVILLEQERDLNTIGGITARWSKIQYRNLEGWVFGGYLTDGAQSQLPVDKAITSIIGETYHLISGQRFFRIKDIEFEVAVEDYGHGVSFIRHGNYILLILVESGNAANGSQLTKILDVVYVKDWDWKGELTAYNCWPDSGRIKNGFLLEKNGRNAKIVVPDYEKKRFVIEDHDINKCRGVLW